MDFGLALFLGFITAVVSVLLPGLINMTAAKISLEEGRTRAVVFAAGASTIVFVQTLIAVLFARFVGKNPNVMIVLREAGLVVFFTLTVYFFWTPRKLKPRNKNVKSKSKKSRFFLGMLLSTLNFFPIPFYIFISLTLASYHYFSFEKPFIYPFVSGSALGAFFTFYCYIAYFNKMQAKTNFLMNNMNYIIGTITGIISIITLINVIKYYFG
ncbi:MAG TPA: lysine transporter LysE [Flavobacterium sp.]|jgi:threonine/homoserine/homoserine lactone efflux protein